MSVCLFTHKTCLLHDPGRFHPESPWRLRALLDALAETSLPWAKTKEIPNQATAEQLVWIHEPSYVDWVLSYRGKHGKIDAETILSPASVDAALWAAGGAVAAVDEVLEGRTKTAWVLGRPPGHHAGTRRGMGFCVFNHVALGVRWALNRGVTRVAILDIDVHHGNGTQEIFWNDPNVLFISSHQNNLFPAIGGTADENGGPDARGTNLNMPMSAGAQDDDFMRVWTELAEPVLDHFRPQLMFVSAGFDAHIDDPLGGLAVTEQGYARFSKWLQQAADRWTQGRSVWVWEGGYDGQALKDCFLACLRTWE
ncbi:MAG: histone deacetylase [Myxococcales bacterium]|nr:histone deacetylase [Myxococcales bacterium]